MARLIKCVRRRGTLDEVKYFLERGFSVKYKDRKGKTALHWCASYSVCHQEENGIPVVRYLLDNGADLNAKDRSGRTPLLTFLDFRCSAVFILLLLDSGADITSRNVLGSTALHYYSKHKHKSVDVCKKLAEGSPVINFKDKNGKTPLMYFLFHGTSHSSHEHIKILLDAGSDVTCVSNCGNTVLHYYALWQDENNSEKNMEILTRLCGNGSLVNKKNFLNSTALMWFTNHRLSVNEICFLLDRGADINAYDDLGNTALHAFFSLRNRNKEVIKVLLEYGADPNIRNKQGQTPMCIALYYSKEDHCNTDYEDYIKLLYCYGGNPNWEHDLIKSYIQRYYIFSSAHQIVYKYMLLESETIFDGHITPDLPYNYRILVITYINCLILEVWRMKNRILVNDLTVFQFVIEPNRRKCALSLKNCSVNLKRLEIEFPQYAGIIKTKLELCNELIWALNRIQSLSIASRQNSGLGVNEIGINTDCLLYMLQFVTDLDIRNLVLASIM